MDKTGPGVSAYLLTLFLMLLFSFSRDGNAAGISTPFSEVVVKNLSVGKNYTIGQKVNRQLRVRNKGKNSIELKMEILVPSKSELKEGYEPIPDPSWIELEKSYFSVAPSEYAVTDVIVTIPGDKKYLGRKYQAHIWSHTAGGGKVPVALGLKSRLLLEISEKERDVSKEFARRYDFAVFPDEMVLENVKITEVCDIEKTMGKVLEVKNLSRYSHVYQLKSVSAKRTGVRVEDGYTDCPNPDFLTFDKAEFGLERKKKSKVKMYFNFPRKKEYAGKKYVFVVRIRLVQEEFLLHRYLKLLVTTSEEF